MNAILAIACNDLRLLVRDKGALFFTVFFPLGLAVFFGAIFGGRGTGKMSVALVVEDPGRRSALFAADIAGDSSLSVVREVTGAEGAAVPLTREQGMEWVRKGRVDACIIVPKGFEAGVTGIFAGQGMKVEGFVAPGHSAESGLLVGKLNELAFRQMSATFSDPAEVTATLDAARQRVTQDSTMPAADRALLGGMFDRIDAVSQNFGGIRPGGSTPDTAASAGELSGGGWRPVDVSMTELKDEADKPRSSWEISFPQGVVWALMGCVTGFGASLSAERARGTLLRLAVSPITPRQVLLGKAGACFAACVGVQVLLIALAVGVFGGLMGKFTVGNPLMLIAAVLVSSIGFTGLMMILAGLTRSEGGASGMGRGLVIVLAMIGGGTVPLFFLPSWVQTLSNISPFKWATVSLEGAIWRGYSWGDCALPYGVLLACGIAGFAVGASALRVGARA